MTTFLNPKSAMNRAQELLNIDQRLAALQVLHDLITSMQGRAWQKTLERIMFKYVDICVDMRRGKFAKDGLLQYRNLCQQVNVGSFEEVIKHFLLISTEIAENAWNQPQALFHDLEADKRPEDLMISYVNGKEGKDRSDDEVVTSWFKFLWESYRTVLEILHDNSKLETLYSKTVLQALQFYKQYKRTTEFCSLCDLIRDHQANLYKYKDQRDMPNFSSPESLQMYLDTRFEQLKFATELALWQEAFRTVEDIHSLMCMVKKTPKASLMVVYYSKLAEIFWVANCPLYHAYAWFNIFTWQKSHNKNLTPNDLEWLASSVVLSAFSVVPYDQMCGASQFEFKNEKEHNLKMANLIGFNLKHKSGNGKGLSHSALLSEIVTRGVVPFASQEVKDLYNLLDCEYIPLDVCSKVQPLLAKISTMGGKLSSASSVVEVQLAQYVPALEKLTTLRLIQQVSKVYQTIKISVLSEMIPFFDYPAIEKVIVEAINCKVIAMRINHSKGVIFGVLDTESLSWREHLIILTEQLKKSRFLIYPPVKKALGVSLPAETMRKEHEKFIMRKLIIEKRKSEIEREEANRKFLDQIFQTTIEERKQILEYEIEEKKISVECQKIKNMTQEEVLIYFNVIKPIKRNRKRRKPLRNKELLLKLDKLLHLMAEKDDSSYMEPIDMNILTLMERRERKYHNLAKTIDLMVRTKRKEETPLLNQAFSKLLIQDQVNHENRQQQEVELSRLCHIEDLEEKNRFARMHDNKIIFQNRITKKREAEHDRLLSEREEVLRTRKQERDAKRKLLFFLKTETEKREAFINEAVEWQKQIHIMKEKVGQKAVYDMLVTSIFETSSAEKYMPKDLFEALSSEKYMSKDFFEASSSEKYVHKVSPDESDESDESM